MDSPDASDAEWRQRHFAREIQACRRAFLAGVTPAIAEAADVCRLYDQPPPEWLCQAIGDLVQQRRTPAEAKRSLEDEVHYARWDMVRECRERGLEQKKSGDDSVGTWERAYEKAADLLAKTAAAGTPERMAKSYMKVERDFREGHAVGRYWIPMDRRFRLVD